MLDPIKMLDNLAAALVEDILAASDDEIAAEMIEDGIDPKAAADEVRQIIRRVIDRHAKDHDHAG